MQIHTARVFLIICLSFLLVFNPLMTAAAVSDSRPAENTSSSMQDIFSSVTYLFGCMLRGDPDFEVDELPPEGALDPLLETAGKYFEGMFQDEAFEDILSEIFDEIAADERIANFDPDALAIKILRDERLSDLLGTAIAERLRDEDFLVFITWLADEIARLLRHDDFTRFIRYALMDFLADDRIVYIIQDFLTILIDVPQGIIEKLREDERLAQVLQDLIDLVMDPFDDMLDRLIADERLTEAFDIILEKIEALPEEFIESLLADVEFRSAVNDLVSFFTEPLEHIVSSMMSKIAEEEILKYFLARLMGMLEGEESFQELMAILHELNAELTAIIGQIAKEIELVMDYYADRPGSGDDSDDPMDNIMDESEVEAEIAEFFEHWAEILGGMFGERADELLDALNKYLEDDERLEGITGAASGVLENSWESFLNDPGLKAAVSENMSDYPVEALIERYENDERLGLIIDEAVNDASVDDLFALIDDRKETFRTVIDEIIATLPLDAVLNGARNGGRNGEDIAAMLDDIILELPYDAIADLLTDEDIDRIIEGLFDIVNELPLDGLAVFLRENAEYIGHTIASELLGGMADSIEFPSDPDPRREAIMESLRSEERMQRLYIDLGADPETLTPESDLVSVIIGLFMEAVEKDDRMERFRTTTEKRSEPLAEEMEDYGQELGGRLRYYLGRLLSPLKRYFDPIRRLFRYDREQDEQLSSLLQSVYLSGGLRWFGGFSSKLLTESGAAGFLGGTMADFLLNYDVVYEVVTPERFSLINNFMAEIEGAEELKHLEAEYFERDFLEQVEEGVISMRETVRLISSAEVTSRINDAILSNLPSRPVQVTVEDAGLEVDDVLESIAVPLEDQLPHLRSIIDDLIIPSFGIPVQFLEDERTTGALEEILEFSAVPAVNVLGNVLQDPLLGEIINELFEDLMEMAPQLFEELGLVLDDPRTVDAVENLIVNLLTDEELLSSVGDFVGDILSDEELLGIIEETLYESVAEATYGFDAYPFRAVYINILNIGLIPVEVGHFRTGCHNGLYYFTEVLMEWLRGENLPPGVISPSDFARQYPLDYLSEARVRENIAGNLALLATVTAGDIITDPELPGFIYDTVNSALVRDPLGVIGGYLKTDQRPVDLLGEALAGFPVENLTSAIRSSDLKELAADIAALVPLDDLVPFVLENENLRGVITDTSITVDMSPLRDIVPLDPGIAGIVLDRVSNFPTGILTGFFREDNRAYRMGYTMADIEARFAVNLLEKPELAQFQSEIILEKLAEADYTLAESVFNVISKFTANERLADFIAEVSAGPIEEAYQNMQERVRSVASWALNSVKRIFTGFFPVFLIVPVAFLGTFKLVRSGRSRR